MFRYRSYIKILSCGRNAPAAPRFFPRAPPCHPGFPSRTSPAARGARGADAAQAARSDHDAILSLPQCIDRGEEPMIENRAVRRTPRAALSGVSVRRWSLRRCRF
eukprot:scaffold3424_cov256-Pinguiococcus_pyrenoidosus.AAC.12